MKKLTCISLLLTLGCFQLHSQNVGIGTNNPSRAKLELHGGVGNTSAIFGGESTGISLQRNFPTIGFNEYYNNGQRYMSGGFAAQQFFDPTLGYMAFDIFSSGNSNAFCTGPKRVMALTHLGDVIVGVGTSRLTINKNPDSDGIHNAALQIKQSLESNNAGITLSDMTDNATWKLSSRNIDDGVLALGLNSFDVGFFNGAGDYITLSDRRMKKDIRDMGSVLGKVMKLQPVEYRMKQNNFSNQVSMGFIAQAVKQHFPGLVHIVGNSATGEDTYNDVHAVNYAGFGVLAIKAIQEQQRLIEALEARIQALESKMTAANGMQGNKF